MNSSLLQNGILRSPLKVGVISSIFAQMARVNLVYAGEVSGA